MAVLEEPIKEPRLVKNFINGEWVESQGEILDVVNPATGRVIGRVPNSTAAEVNAAVAAAKEAYPDWRRTPPRCPDPLSIPTEGTARRAFRGAESYPDAGTRQDHR